nr:TusE/DsrC/DsvC family sulfur relay protein [Actinomycetales bacterium]
MPTATIAGTTVNLNEEGFLTEPTQWTDEIGAELAGYIGLAMTDEH